MGCARAQLAPRPHCCRRTRLMRYWKRQWSKARRRAERRSLEDAPKKDRFEKWFY